MKKSSNVYPSDFLSVFPLGSSLRKSEKEVVALRILFIKSQEGNTWESVKPETYEKYVMEKRFEELKCICEGYDMFSMLFEIGAIQPHWERQWFEELNQMLNSPEDVGKIHPAWEEVRQNKENESA